MIIIQRGGVEFGDFGMERCGIWRFLGWKRVEFWVTL